MEKKMKHKLNQNGLVTIVSIILIVLIITVITLSLATLIRRELRQSIDEQLSSQALYAAESGINDAIKKISDGTITGSVTGCDQTSPEGVFSNQTISSDENVRYTCILVNQTPPVISTDIQKETVKSYPIISSTGQTVSSLTFTWKSLDSAFTPNIAGCDRFDFNRCLRAYNTWGNRLPLLRVRLLPYPSSDFTSSINPIDVIAYPGPRSGVSDSTLTLTPNGLRQKMLFATCSSTNKNCTVSISGLGSGGDLSGRYYLQIYSYYGSTNIKINGKDQLGGEIKFSGAQAEIDATGVAQDVLRRMKVYVTLNQTSALPNFTLGVGDKLCKRFTTNASGTADGSDAINCPAF